MNLPRSTFFNTIAGLALLGVAAIPQAALAQTTSVFSFTGADQSFPVPAGVTSITVKLWGAGGGSNGFASNGGNGAFVTGLLSVTPGTTLTLIVGGAGGNNAGGFGGGANGSGSPTGGGGGRSAIRLSSTELVTAGAGGGGGSIVSGGVGGLTTGGSGGAGGGGGGGTQSAGGAAGSIFANAGSQFQGGSAEFTSGGGGGGYFGGGGGSNGRGGGGGSSFLGNLTASGASAAGDVANPGGIGDPNYATGIGRGRGVINAAGNGQIVLIYTVGVAPEPSTLAFLALGGTLVLVKRRRK